MFLECVYIRFAITFGDLSGMENQEIYHKVFQSSKVGSNQKLNTCSG